MTIRIKKRLSIIYLVLFIVLTIASFTFNVSFLLELTFFVFLSLLIYSLTKFKDRFILAFFLASFFLFLLGGEFAYQYFGFSFDDQFSETINNHAYFSCVISLVFIWIGYVIAEHTSSENKRFHLSLTSNDDIAATIFIRKIGEWGIYLTFIPTMIRGVEVGLYAQQHGYTSIYTMYSSSLPTIIMSLSQMFTLFLFMFLATLPEKKRCIVPLLMYLIYGGIDLLAGRRLQLGASIMVIICYLILRQYRNPEEKWITKKMIVPSIVASVLLLFFLYSFRFMRYGETVEQKSFFGVLLGFLSQQGVSIDILKYQKLYEGDELKWTSLYYTLRYLRISVLTRHLSGFPTELYDYRSWEEIVKTGNLSGYIMFNISKYMYYNGYGLGTSYIAELYHDFGYAGISIYSLVLGWVLKRLFVFEEKFDIWRVTISFLILEKLVVLPRYGADSILLPFYNLANVIVVIGILLLIALLSNNQKKTMENEYYD